jgi:hypothetical protein
MEKRSAIEQSSAAGRIAAREMIEKNQPFFSIAVLFCVGVVMLVRAAWHRDVFEMIVSAVLFLVAGPLFALWRYKGSRRPVKGASE